MKKNLFLTIAVCLLAACGKLTVDNTPVASIELDRYLGSLQTTLDVLMFAI